MIFKQAFYVFFDGKKEKYNIKRKRRFFSLTLYRTVTIMNYYSLEFFQEEKNQYSYRFDFMRYHWWRLRNLVLFRRRKRS